MALYTIFHRMIIGLFLNLFQRKVEEKKYLNKLCEGHDEKSLGKPRLCIEKSNQMLFKNSGKSYTGEHCA